MDGVNSQYFTGDEPAPSDDDDAIVKEAKARFLRCQDWESTARRNWQEDYKFSHGDSFNMYQWDPAVRHVRGDDKPALTINKTEQQCLQIINDGKQNKPSVKFRPVGNEATAEAADVYDGIMRHIEYISKAQTAYDTAQDFQVRAGLGYVRIDTDYIDDDSRDQEIYIRRVKDPLTIYLDPDAQEADYSDMRFAFVFEDLPKDEFKVRYPDYAPMSNGLGYDSDWIDDQHVRVAEYWRKTEFRDMLISMIDDRTGDWAHVRKSRVVAELASEVLADPRTKTRPIRSNRVEHYILAGNLVLEREPWLGIYIPIVPMIGKETVIEKRLDRKGHTRASRDPQLMYNYIASEAVVQLALQPKTPYITDLRAIEDLENYWRDSNVVDFPYLPYNGVDDEGNPIPPPTKNIPPQLAAAYVQAMQIAEGQLAMVSGQYQSQFGEPSNERSGKAINERQRQGDNATYHFIDGQAICVRQVGRICQDLMTKVYDAQRMVQVLGEDGKDRRVMLDPNAQASYQKHVVDETNTVLEVFNPNVGRYDVQADIGPAYSTRRQEAWNAFVQIAAQAPQVMQIAGDLVFRAADFPMAEELADRFKRTIPPGILGDDDALPPAVQQQLDQAKQQVVQLMGQNQQLMAVFQRAKSRIDELQSKQVGREQHRDIEAYRAETDRLGVMSKVGIDHQQIAQLAAQLVMDTLNTQLTDVTSSVKEQLTQSGALPSPLGANAGGAPPSLADDGVGGAPTSPGNGGMQPPIPGARQAPDGNFYVPDPRRPGKHMLVVH